MCGWPRRGGWLCLRDATKRVGSLGSAGRGVRARRASLRRPRRSTPTKRLETEAQKSAGSCRGLLSRDPTLSVSDGTVEQSHGSGPAPGIAGGRRPGSAVPTTYLGRPSCRTPTIRRQRASAMRRCSERPVLWLQDNRNWDSRSPRQPNTYRTIIFLSFHKSKGKSACRGHLCKLDLPFSGFYDPCARPRPGPDR
jgi:hypothetical protein